VIKRNKIYIFRFIIVLISCLVLLASSSCNFIYKKSEIISSNISFNYPGLRVETRSVELDEIKDNFPRVVCFGDSVTFGWNLKYEDSYPQLLENSLYRDYTLTKVINSGIGGDTILDAINRLEKDALCYNPHIIIINFGLNDGMLVENKENKINKNESLSYSEGEYNYTTQVSLEKFNNCYRVLINSIKSNDIKLIVVGINPVLNSFPKSKDEDFRKKQKEIYDLYNKEIIEIAEDEDVIFLNLWNLFTEDINIENYMQEDGIHPNKKGLELIADNIYMNLIAYDMINQIEVE
jgi:lysophospholipase L1-like esterase